MTGKEKNTKLTLNEIIKRKIQIEESKKQRKKAVVYVDSLQGCVTLIEPEKKLLKDIQKMDNEDEANSYALYNCIIEPDIKDKSLIEAYECSEPTEIIDKIFTYSEIVSMGSILNRMLGSVSVVEEIKN